LGKKVKKKGGEMSYRRHFVARRSLVVAGEASIFEETSAGVSIFRQIRIEG